MARASSVNETGKEQLSLLKNPSSRVEAAFPAHNRPVSKTSIQDSKPFFHHFFLDSAAPVPANPHPPTRNGRTLARYTGGASSLVRAVAVHLLAFAVHLRPHSP